MSALADFRWDEHDILVPVGPTTPVLRQENPMDPDQVLADMRNARSWAQKLHDEADKLMEQANATGVPNDEFFMRQLAFDQDRVAANSAAALDGWLSAGGFLPAAWRR